MPIGYTCKNETVETDDTVDTDQKPKPLKTNGTMAPTKDETVKNTTKTHKATKAEIVKKNEDTLAPTKKPKPLKKKQPEKNDYTNKNENDTTDETIPTFPTAGIARTIMPDSGSRPNQPFDSLSGPKKGRTNHYMSRPSQTLRPNQSFDGLSRQKKAQPIINSLANHCTTA